MRLRNLKPSLVFFCHTALLFFCYETFAQSQSIDSDDGVSARDRARKVENELSVRQSAIENIQSGMGIYDTSLIEAYSDLAAFYFELEDYQNSSRIYSDALQVSRVNTGLYSLEQIPIIESLIKNSHKREEWQTADDFQELLYFISSRIYSPADQEYLKFVESFGAWKLRIVRENLLDQTSFGLLTTAEKLSLFYSRVIEQFELEPGVKNESLINVIVLKSQTDMTLARSVAGTPFSVFEGTERRYTNQTRCRNVRNPAGQVVRQCYSVQVENPRYRQSQREAKQFALSRHTREISRSIDKLEEIRNTSSELSLNEKQLIESRIAELVIESEQLVIASRRSYLY
ncbi:MAG: hypothetical protein P8K27_08510 [Gammaproteobacteria bacterium]|nr:hypothetical protein [Gammaproteobacteria bacterium]